MRASALRRLRAPHQPSERSWPLLLLSLLLLGLPAMRAQQNTPCGIELDQSFACTNKLLDTRLDSDTNCIDSAVNVIHTNLLQTRTAIYGTKVNQEFTLTSCLNRLHMYDPNQASKYDIFLKLRNASVDSVSAIDELFSNVTGIFDQFRFLKELLPNVFKVQLLVHSEDGILSVSYPRTVQSPCADIFFASEPNSMEGPEDSFTGSDPFISGTSFDPIISFSIPVYYYEMHRGQLNMQVFFSSLISEILLNQPTQNGHYILVDSSDNLVGGSHTAIQWLYGPTQTITQVTQNALNKIEEYAAEGFRSIIPAIHRGESRMTVSSKDTEYTVFISNPIRSLFFLLAVVPSTDLTLGASWAIRESILNLRYLSTDKEVSNYFTIDNTGLFTVNYQVDGNGVYTVSPSEGSIRGGSVKIITVTLCLESGCPSQTPSLIVRSTGDQTGSCFQTLVVPVKRENADCKESDFALYGSDCEAKKRRIRFDWLQPKVCMGGIALPKNFTVDCEHVSEPFVPIVFMVVMAVISMIVLYSFVLMFLSHYVIDVVYRMKEPAIYFMGLGVILQAVSPLLFSFSKNGLFCFAEGLCNAVGKSLVTSALLSAAQYSYTLNTQKQLIFETDLSYVLKRAVPVFVVMMIAFLVLMGDRWVLTMKDYYSTHELALTTCGTQLILALIIYIVPVVVDLSSAYFLYQVLRTPEMDEETMSETKYGFVCLLLDIVGGLIYAVADSSNGFLRAMLAIPNYLFIVFIFLYYSPLYFSKKGQGDEKMKMRQMSVYQSILDEPITRAELKAFMKILLQEESILFWEEINEFKKFTAKKYDRAEMLRRVKHIYQNYIVPGCEWEVNISATMRHEITKELEAPEPKPSIYDVAFEEINRLIIFNNVVPFCVSEQAKDANKISRWWATYQKLESELQEGVKEKLSEEVLPTGLNGTCCQNKKTATRSLFG